MKRTFTLLLFFIFSNNMSGQSNMLKAELHFLLLYSKVQLGYERTIHDNHALDIHLEAGHLWILEDWSRIYEHSSCRFGYKYYFNKSSEMLPKGPSLGCFALFGKSRHSVSNTLIESLYRDYGLGLEFIIPVRLSKTGAFTMDFGLSVIGLIKAKYSETLEFIDDQGNYYGETTTGDPIKYFPSGRIQPVWGFTYRF